MRNTMTWKVSAINAMTSNTQNNNEKDMCIEEALMTFENSLIEKVEFEAYDVYDSNRNLIKSVKATTANPEDYADILSDTTKSYCFIYGMDELLKIDENRYRACFNIDGGVGSFYLTFTFSTSKVEWNNYIGEAWYEHPKWKKE